MIGKELSDKDLEERIQELTQQARECIANKQYSKFVELQNQKWNLIPNPKEDWEESYRICKVLITFYIKYDINFTEADKWLIELKRLDDIQDQHPGEVSLMQGKFFFEKKEYKKAYERFDEAFKVSEGHCFGSTDREYQLFYSNPNDLLRQ